MIFFRSHVMPRLESRTHGNYSVSLSRIPIFWNTFQELAKHTNIKTRLKNGYLKTCMKTWYSKINYHWKIYRKFDRVSSVKWPKLPVRKHNSIYKISTIPFGISKHVINHQIHHIIKVLHPSQENISKNPIDLHIWNETKWSNKE